MKDIFQVQRLSEAYTRRQEPEYLRAVADAYWAILIGVAALAIALCLAYGTWQFLVPPEGATTEGAATAGIVGFNHEQLKMLVEMFQKQQSEFETLMTP